MLSCQSTFRQGCKRRTFLVDRKFKALQWRVANFTFNQLVHVNRYVNQGVGVHMSGDINRRTMVTGGTEGSDQHTRPEAVRVATLNFTKLKIVQRIHVLVDSKVALSYLVKMGGTHNKDLSSVSKQIWDYLQSKKITVTAEYLPSHLNVTAD